MGENRSSNAADALIDGICNAGAPIVVGLDPVLGRFPDVYCAGRPASLEGAARAIEDACMDIIDAVCGVAPAVKPQAAFFELYGSQGITALEHVCSHAREAGLSVIEDAKCNDIGNTAKAYAQAHCGSVEVPGGGTVRSSIDADFLTVSPYEGLEGLQPFFDICADGGKGIFVLVKTSNPGSLMLQTAQTSQGQTVGEHVASLVAVAADACKGSRGYSPIGAVVGATYPEQAAAFRAMMPCSLFLVPGYGAQGAGASEVVPCFNEDGLGAIVNSSRGIIYAYEKRIGKECSRKEYIAATRQAAEAMRDDIRGALAKACPRMEY